MTTKRCFTTLILLAFACTLTAQAQPASTVTLFQDYVPTAQAFAVDISAMSTDARVILSKEQTQKLRSPDEQTREEALQHVIYLATHYKDTIDAGSAATYLYEIYKLDRNEQLRIMALVGLHAIGSENAMRQLIRDVRLEHSEKVRRLTNVALADYFDTEKK